MAVPQSYLRPNCERFLTGQASLTVPLSFITYPLYICHYYTAVPVPHIKLFLKYQHIPNAPFLCTKMRYDRASHIQCKFFHFTLTVYHQYCSSHEVVFQCLCSPVIRLMCIFLHIQPHFNMYDLCSLTIV